MHLAFAFAPILALLASLPQSASAHDTQAVAAPAAPSPLATSQAANNGPLHIPFEKYTLPSNGLEVILSEDHSLPIVAVNIWYHAGPINEAPQRTGFAHLFEHLMFQGSKHVGDDQHFKLLESRGASLINGTTDFDRTNYFQTVPANELELALWLESDRMGFLVDALTQDKLDNQRQVVMNERRQSIDNLPYGPSGEKLVQTLFDQGHPYHGYVMGSMDDLAQATLDDVKHFYGNYYAPANATLVISGDFEASQAKALVATYFASLQRRDRPVTKAIATKAIAQQRRVVVREKVKLPRLSQAYLSPSAYQPGDADADILATILGGGESSRLYRRLVYGLQIAQDISVSQESLALSGMFVVSATGKPGHSLDAIEAEIDKVLSEMRNTGPKHEELTRARNLLKTQLVNALQGIGGFGGKADMLNRYNQYVGDPGYLATDIARYDAVSAESIKALAQKMLVDTARVVIVTEPEPA